MKYEYKDPYEGIQVIECDADDIREVSAEVMQYLEESRKSIQNADRKERYHTPCHIEANAYESEEYADTFTAENAICETEDKEHLHGCLKRLTATQRRRLLRYADGETLECIAKDEGVSIASVRESIISASEKIRKFY